jgi:DNA repair protein RAD5
MIDCPDVLHSGADLIISLSIYLRASAFKSPNESTPTSLQSRENTKMMFNEGQETLDEQILRERKKSLLKLFDVVGLKARAGADFSKHRGKLHGEAVTEVTQTNKPAIVKTEIVGDGEEVEVEDGEDLSENELDMIYKKCVYDASYRA